MSTPVFNGKPFTITEADSPNSTSSTKSGDSAPVRGAQERAGWRGQLTNSGFTGATSFSALRSIDEGENSWNAPHSTRTGR
jgi:hypothetical protein